LYEYLKYNLYLLKNTSISCSIQYLPDTTAGSSGVFARSTDSEKSNIFPSTKAKKKLFVSSNGPEKIWVGR